MKLLFNSVALVALLSSFVTADPTQYWHERYHGLLSMAAYGDYATTCPLAFTQATLHKSYPGSTEAPFTILSEWGPTASGISGFNVVIPGSSQFLLIEIESGVALYGWEALNMTAGSIDVLGIANCSTCTAHQGALTAYLEAKAVTNDFADVKAAVAATGHQWSITGHGFGGMVAQIAALDNGWRGRSHWSHAQGSSRVFNAAAANVYNSLYQGEASQRTVANQDSVPTIIPEGPNYTFVLEGFHIFGTNTTYGMNYEICQNSPTDPACLGGNNMVDNAFYYTPIGYCGGGQTSYQADYQAQFQARARAAAGNVVTSQVAAFATVTAANSTSTAPSTSSISNSTSSTSTSGSVPSTSGAASSTSSMITVASTSTPLVAVAPTAAGNAVTPAKSAGAASIKSQVEGAVAGLVVMLIALAY